jgi:hypothetical protein
MESKEIKSLMEAYASVYAQQEEEQLDEGIDFKGAAREQARRDKIQKKKDEKNPSGRDRRLAMGKFRPGASQEERASGGRDSMREKGIIPKKGGKDMFEQVLEHLVAEGYADTNDAALAIMANMSEEWRQSIVEELEQLDEISDRRVQRVVNARNRRFDRSVDSGAPNKEFYQARRSNKLAARRNERTGSNVKVDPDLAR